MTDESIIENPVWQNAQYEIQLIFANGVRKSYMGGMFPIRGNEIVDGRLIPVPQFITVREAREQMSLTNKPDMLKVKDR